MSDYTKAGGGNTVFDGTERRPPALPQDRVAGPNEGKMSEKAGETVRESADYRCERCHKVTPMAKGSLIQPCPHCGYDTFDISNPRFERRDGSLGPHEPG
jgi:DNA-directed RNA polymerase subunit RPC12/RpoP